MHSTPLITPYSSTGWLTALALLVRFLRESSHILLEDLRLFDYVPTLLTPHLISLAYPRARSLGHFYSPFTPLLSPTSLKPTIYNNTNMLMTHNCSWLSPQVMCMLKYPLSNLVCHHYKLGSVPIVCFWIQINPTQYYGGTSGSVVRLV